MHFLNGGRKYIKPDLQCHTFEQQLSSCLRKLEQSTLRKRIYKLNFFADAASSGDYLRLKEVVGEKVARLFPGPVICSVIAQPPVTCLILAEAFYYDESHWSTRFHPAENGSAISFEKDGAGVLVGQVQSCKADVCSTVAAEGFQSMSSLLEIAGFSLHSVVRQWNYIENILAYENGIQRYQEFNNIRAAFYGDSFNTTGFPAATGIGIRYGGIIIEFVAVNAPGAVNLPLDNPQQVAAHAYSPDVLAGETHMQKSTPKFERARYLELFGQKQLFISGTASIRGEKTAGPGNPEEQTRITIENIQQLYCKENIQHVTGNNIKPTYGHARVYIKNCEDFPVVRQTFKSFYGNLPVVYLQADICRDDLLVEIEGKVILKRQAGK